MGPLASPPSGLHHSSAAGTVVATVARRRPHAHASGSPIADGRCGGISACCHRHPHGKCGTSDRALDPLAHLLDGIGFMQCLAGVVVGRPNHLVADGFHRHDLLDAASWYTVARRQDGMWASGTVIWPTSAILSAALSLESYGCGLGRACESSVLGCDHCAPSDIELRDNTPIVGEKRSCCMDSSAHGQ
jgi:hypothetical protein